MNVSWSRLTLKTLCILAISKVKRARARRVRKLVLPSSKFSHLPFATTEILSTYYLPKEVQRSISREKSLNISFFSFMSQEIQWCFETVNGTKNLLNTVHRSYSVSLNPLMKHSKNDFYDSILSDFKYALSLHSGKVRHLCRCLLWYLRGSILYWFYTSFSGNVD